MSQDIRNMDIENKNASASIALADALARLEKNRDFKKVIEEGYFKEFAHNLVAQRAMPEMRSTESVIATNTRKLDAISELRHWFRGVRSMGYQGQLKLDANKQEAARILSEEDEG